MGIQTSSINNGPTAGFKNVIINGNFDFWQRGTSATADSAFAADRWQLQRSGSTCTMSQQTFAVGQTDVPNNPTYWIRNAVTSAAGASNIVFMRQYIEDVRTFAGQQITISYWAKADAAKPISIEAQQFFGAGGSPSAQVHTFVAKPTLSTSWVRYSHQITIPSISGKTIGTTANTSSLAINFWFDAGSDFNSRTNTLGQQSGTFDIAQVQVEEGPVATDFERRPPGTELALCQRYCEVIPLQGSIPGGLIFSCQSNTSGFGLVGFQVEKRATPVYTVGAGGFNVQAGGNVVQSVTTVTAYQPTTKGGVGIIFSAGAAGAGSVVHQAASSGPLIASAEL